MEEHSDSSSFTQDISDTHPPEASQVVHIVEYGKHLLMRGREEMSVEELRAEKYFQQNKKKLRLPREGILLSRELELKRQQNLRETMNSYFLTEDESGDACATPAAPSLDGEDDSQPGSASSARRTSSQELPDDVFLKPDEMGQCGKVQLKQESDAGEAQETYDKLPVKRHGKESDLAAVSKTRGELSTIEEKSWDAASASSGNNSPQEPEHTATSEDPCDPTLRQSLLERRGVFASPDLHREPRPAPIVTERSFVYLGGAVFYINSRLVDRGSFSVFNGHTEVEDILMKVDCCLVPWDFHLFIRLKENAPAAARPPLIRCYLFTDCCVTIYSPMQDDLFRELSLFASDEPLVRSKTSELLQLLTELHSCRVVHGGLRPQVLTCCSTGWVFPKEWSTAVDLELQGVESAQQLPSARVYINTGLLEPSAPAHLVDLLGLAETVHHLLTGSAMVPVTDENGWTIERFSKEEPRDVHSQMWRKFFRTLLNPGGRSALTILSELKELLDSFRI